MKNGKQVFFLELLNLSKNYLFKNVSPLIASLRMVKDEEEIKHMKVSSEINDKTMEKSDKSCSRNAFRTIIG